MNKPKTVVLIPKEKSNDLKFVRDIVEDMLIQNEGGHKVCASGSSLEFRIEEDQIATMLSNHKGDIIYKVDTKKKWKKVTK